jgi:signal transduction histidine kinase
VQSLRGIALELRPGVLDQLGLVAALEWLGIEFQKRHGVKVASRSDVETLDAPQDRQLAFFRIAQEALTNVARHAQATEAAIQIHSLSGRIVMEITDNGCGIPKEKIERRHSFGLISMQERGRLAGAECRILSSPGKGTTVRVTWPAEGPVKAAQQSQAAQGEFN